MLFLIILIKRVIEWILKKNPDPIFGVYQRPGKWYYLKYIIIYLFLLFRKISNRSRQKVSESHAGYGVKSKSDLAKMDCPQILSNDPNAADCVYISGFNEKGFYFVAAATRWPKRAISGFWFLKIPHVGLLTFPKIPESTIYSNEDMKFSADGLLIEPIEPMKKWRVTYDGNMKLHKTGNLVHTKIDLIFKSELPIFDFDTDIPIAPMARAIAKEPWSRQYFENLRDSHQTHYEQMGGIFGTAEIDGYGSYRLRMNSYRDHSYGKKREWKYLHRYGLHSAATKDGTMFTVGIVSQPISFATLEIGYVYTPEGLLYGVDWCDLKLHLHGEEGNPPKDYSFCFGAGGRTYEVKVRVEDLAELYMGRQWEAKFFERFCTFEVNGVKGRGISEWEYRNKKVPRPEETFTAQ